MERTSDADALLQHIRNKGYQVTIQHLTDEEFVTWAKAHWHPKALAETNYLNEKYRDKVICKKTLPDGRVIEGCMVIDLASASLETHKTILDWDIFNLEQRAKDTTTFVEA